jgi:hypothetical protein
VLRLFVVPVEALDPVVGALVDADAAATAAGAGLRGAGALGDEVVVVVVFGAVAALGAAPAEIPWAAVVPGSKRRRRGGSVEASDGLDGFAVTAVLAAEPSG